MFGIVCGLGSIIVTEYMDDSFRSVEEVQRILKLPVLGTIPKTVSHFAWERKKKGRMVLSGSYSCAVYRDGLRRDVYICKGAAGIKHRSRTDR